VRSQKPKEDVRRKKKKYKCHNNMTRAVTAEEVLSPSASTATATTAKGKIIESD
jgi:hypothetical protein